MGARVPAHVRWAVEALDVHDGERILDIGSGNGGSVELLLDALAPLRLGAPPSVVAGDRSAVAVRRMSARLQRVIATGAVEVVHSALADLDAGDASFDAAIAVNVNAFWTSAAIAAIHALGRMLRPGGRLLIAFDHGPTALARAARVERMVDALERSEAFTAVDVNESSDGFAVGARGM